MNALKSTGQALIVLLLLMTAVSSPHRIQEPDKQETKNLYDRIDEVVQALYDNGQFMGAVLVSIDGKIVYKNAVGYADIEKKVPHTPDTKFRIASFTKAFTAMLILQLAEDGTLSLEGKLIDYLPDFKKDPAGKITIRHLLSHTSGITGEGRIPDLADIEKKHYSRRQLFDCIAERELVFEPGKGYEYSNFGYALLGLIIERVTGKTYDEALHEQICAPAGMKSTLSDVNAIPIDRRAVGYTYDYFDGPREASYLDMSFCLGAGQLLSTVEDLHLFDQALYTEKLLGDKSKELFFNNYGWRYQNYPYGKGSKRVRSNNLEGSCNGFQSHTQRIARDKVFVVALRNIKEAVYENQIAVKWPSAIASPVLSIIYGEDYDLPKMSAAFAVFQKLMDSGYGEAQIACRRLRGQPEKFYFDTEEFHFFVRLLNEGNKPELAKQLADITVETQRVRSSAIERDQVRDIDGNVYQTVKIGDQWWMAENLRVTRDPDGNSIESYFYNDDPVRYGRFGRLYTWNAAMNSSESENAQGIAPDGWHIPSEEDWDELVRYLGGERNVGGKIAVGGETGFGAILAGGADAKGNYVYFQEYAMFWSSTWKDGQRAYHMGIGKNHQWDKFAALKTGRIHVRCVKDKDPSGRK